MKKSLTLLAATLALAAAPAFAQSTNLTTWTGFGDVLKGPTSATLTTAAADESPLTATPAVNYIALEAAMGTTFDADTYEGSGLRTSFVAAAATTLSFKWSFNTLTSAFDPAFADRAYLVIDGVATALATATGTLQTGSFSTTFAAGSHSFGFAVLDYGDVTDVSTLTVSDLQVAAVPEPATALTMLAGLLVTAAAVRRRRG